MTVDLNAVKIYIRPGATDLRKAASGLTVLVQEQMQLDPLSGSVYLGAETAEGGMVGPDGILAGAEAAGTGAVSMAGEQRRGQGVER